jgi:hypothetical protein
MNKRFLIIVVMLLGVLMVSPTIAQTGNKQKTIADKKAEFEAYKQKKRQEFDNYKSRKQREFD